MRDNLDGVAVFVEVVDAGGFARAAERLALTRSAVGKTIARLESRLGVRLFQRTTRTQNLTDEGQIFYERCVRAITEVKTAEQMLESGRREVSGRLKISLPALFGRHCVQPVLLDFAAKHPSLELDLSFSDKVVDIIGDGYDLAIRNGKLGDSAGLMARKLLSQPKVVCASPAYIEAFGRPADIASLPHHEALLYIRNGQIFPWILNDGKGSMVQAEVKGRLRFDSQESIADAAVLGFGVAWLPYWLIKTQIARGDLISLLEPFASPPIDTYAVWPTATHLPMRLRAVIDLLAAELPQTVGRYPSAGIAS